MSASKLMKWIQYVSSFLKYQSITFLAVVVIVVGIELSCWY